MFCRHGRREERCVVCSNEKRKKAARANVGTGRITSARGAAARSASRSAASGAHGTRRVTATATTSGGVRVKKVTRHAEDGWSSDLLPGLRASQEAVDLLREIARGQARLDALVAAPPGPYATVKALAEGDADDREQAAWLLFQIAYYGPLEGDEPFAEIESLLVRWDAPLPPLDRLEAAKVGPRGSHAHDRGHATLAGYRELAARADGQLAALTGHGADAARRFDAAYRALALPGLARPARYEFVVTLGVFGLLDVAPWSLLLDATRGGRDPLSVASKRAFLTGDAVLLQRRFGAFVRALDASVAACDLGFLNWELRASPTAPLGYLQAGVPVEPDPATLARFAKALGLPGDEAGEETDPAAAPAEG